LVHQVYIDVIVCRLQFLRFNPFTYLLIYFVSTPYISDKSLSITSLVPRIVWILFCFNYILSRLTMLIFYAFLIFFIIITNILLKTVFFINISVFNSQAPKRNYLYYRSLLSHLASLMQKYLLFISYRYYPIINKCRYYITIFVFKKRRWIVLCKVYLLVVLSAFGWEKNTLYR